MSKKDLVQDIKHDDNPDADENEMDFGDSLDDGVADDEEEEGSGDGEKEEGDGDADGEDDGAAGEEGDAEGEGGEEGEEGEGADDADGAGDGEADGEDGEDDPRAKGLNARAGAAMVPSYRLRQANTARERAEARAAELEAQLAQLSGTGKSEDPVKVIDAELEQLYEQVEEARAEGRVKDAAKLQKTIDSKNREVTELRSTRIATQQALRAAEAAAYDATVSELEAKFPELNPDNEELFDPDLADEVLDLRDGFIKAKGMKPKDALKKAIAYVFKPEVLETGTAPLYAKNKEGGQKKDKAKEAGAKRKAEAVKTNIKANGRQPARMDGTGKADTKAEKLDPKTLSDKDWDALPESTLARLRGDYVGS